MCTVLPYFAISVGDSGDLVEVKGEIVSAVVDAGKAPGTVIVMSSYV